MRVLINSCAFQRQRGQAGNSSEAQLFVCISCVQYSVSSCRVGHRHGFMCLVATSTAHALALSCLVKFGLLERHREGHTQQSKLRLLGTRNLESNTFATPTQHLKFESSSPSTHAPHHTRKHVPVGATGSAHWPGHGQRLRPRVPHVQNQLRQWLRNVDGYWIQQQVHPGVCVCVCVSVCASGGRVCPTASVTLHVLDRAPPCSSTPPLSRTRLSRSLLLRRAHCSLA
jgi:hypothetical protein